MADAAATKMPTKSKTALKAKCPTLSTPAAKHRVSAAAKKGAGPKYARKAASTKYGTKAKCRKVTRWVCPKKSAVRRTARPAAAARGPVVNCPAPVVNVPEQPAPVVNVPQQPAPVVNVPSPPPTVGITTDNCFIYIVRGDQLMVFDKNTYCLKKTVPLQ